MKKQSNFKVPIMIYPCIAGLFLFLTAAIVGCIISRDGISFILLAVYGAFALFSFIQEKIINKMQSLREKTAVFNLLLYFKTAIIFSIFLFPGTFGNIHSENFIGVFQSVLLFCCVVFAIINFYFEKIYLIKHITKSDNSTMLKDNAPAVLRRILYYYPLLFGLFLFVTVIIYIFAMGFVGPSWLISNIIIYSLLNMTGFTLLLGENKLVTDILYTVISLAKNAFAIIFYAVFLPSAYGYLDNRPAFAGAFNAFLYIDLAVLCIGIVIDILIVYFIFHGLITKNCSKN